MGRGKRELIASFLHHSGVLRLFESAQFGNSLVVLNYHRVIEPADCTYDRAVISATPDQFYEQVTYLRSHFHNLSLAELIENVESGRHTGGSHIMITFDDGYIDNYRTAYPILRSAGLPAVFFPVTSYIGSQCVPWWDQIANLLRRSRNRTIRLDYPEERTFTLEEDTLEVTIRQVLQLFKSPAMRHTERYLAALERACGVPREERADPPLFMNWDQAREMAGGGMSIGSHTHSHGILSKMSAAEQVQELRLSKDLSERELRAKVTSLSIPVGRRDCYNRDTEKALAETGYQVAFSFYDGVNRMGNLRRFDITRTGVEQSMAFARVRCKAALGTSMGRVW